MKSIFRISPHHHQRSLFIAILFLGAVWIGITAVFFPNTTTSTTLSPKEGFLAPDFNIQATNGEFYKLSEHQDKIIMVNFWTSWCPPCKAEMPAMERVFLDYKDQDFIILAVNATRDDSVANAASFVEQHQLTFPILLDIEGFVTHQYQIHSFPTTFFIGQDGVIAEIVIGGPMSEALLRTRIETMVGGVD